MNERIKELAEIARRKPMGNSWTYAHLDEFEQRFAELIVRECISAVEDTNDRYRRDYFAAKIKEHFGVKDA